MRKVDMALCDLRPAGARRPRGRPVGAPRSPVLLRSVPVPAMAAWPSMLTDTLPSGGPGGAGYSPKTARSVAQPGGAQAVSCADETHILPEALPAQPGAPPQAR